jgi:hypothetical protein
LAVPYLPPGQILCALLGNSETAYPIAGISGESLVAGVVNGLVWGVIIITLYCYSRGPKKGRVILPAWVPSYTTSRASTVERKISTQYGACSSEVRAAETEPVESIEGIGNIYGHMLRNLDIDCVDDLLVIGSTQTGIQYLAHKLNVSPSIVSRWVNHAKALVQHTSSV